MVIAALPMPILERPADRLLYYNSTVANNPTYLPYKLLLLCKIWKREHHRFISGEGTGTGAINVHRTSRVPRIKDMVRMY